ncbi:MAG: DapH/DapD/GlmU-related protein [Gammaproteobacteria bacterium]|nr:DapH/DapD/GlmU-related protein [Gammaproteobacteria bacterium]
MMDTYFPAPLKTPSEEVCEIINAAVETRVQEVLPEVAARLADKLDGAEKTAFTRLAELDQMLLAVKCEDDDAIQSTPEAYLKLHLFSHRLALPNTLNLDGIFEHLPTLAWTTEGPVDLADVQARIIEARTSGRTLSINSVDKFPRMTDYVVPSGVRIADSSRVRLGAYLGDGTTVMPPGFINFNAGALGPNMVEGRVSQGVTLGEHSDLGGSASLMGTLSGGGNIVITVGKHCLVGANAGSGIPLGDRCTIEAGLYITAGTVVEVIDETGESRKVKARDLAGQNDMLFIRHSQTGRVQCRTNKAAIELNEKLHAHN